MLRHLLTPPRLLLFRGWEKRTFTALERTFEEAVVVVVYLRHSLTKSNNLLSWKLYSRGSD